MWTLLSTSFIFHIFCTEQIYVKVTIFSSLALAWMENGTATEFIVNFRCIKNLIVSCCNCAKSFKVGGSADDTTTNFFNTWRTKKQWEFSLPFLHDVLTRNLLLCQSFGVLSGASPLRKYEKWSKISPCLKIKIISLYRLRCCMCSIEAWCFSSKRRNSSDVFGWNL